MLALYIRTENPSWQLKLLVKYILEAFGPTSFDIVLHPQVYNGAYHFFNYMKRSKACLTEELWEKISKVFAMGENETHLIFCSGTNPKFLLYWDKVFSQCTLNK